MPSASLQGWKGHSFWKASFQLWENCRWKAAAPNNSNARCSTFQQRRQPNVHRELSETCQFLGGRTTNASPWALVEKPSTAQQFLHTCFSRANNCSLIKRGRWHGPFRPSGLSKHASRLQLWGVGSRSLNMGTLVLQLHHNLNKSTGPSACIAMSSMGRYCQNQHSSRTHAWFRPKTTTREVDKQKKAGARSVWQLPLSHLGPGPASPACQPQAWQARKRQPTKVQHQVSGRLEGFLGLGRPTFGRLEPEKASTRTAATLP